MANLITFARFLLLFILVAMAYHPNPFLQVFNLPLLILLFVLDGVDGYVARRRREESLFGAIFDIAIDRVVENVLWIVMVDLGFISVWVAIVFITRSFLVDSIRAQAASVGETPFGMMKSPLGRFLVSGRFMRAAYAALKGTSFGWMFAIQPLPGLFPEFYAGWESLLTLGKDLLVYLTVAVCLLRGLPVLAEAVLREDGIFARIRRRN